ncbi:MAG: IPExxxVDY family protein [Cyclobacteriaceae bacterium]|jgi:hypothetical protein|nr:IPExxxVDY family protein [Cyclobacteriaceae bacterium]
MKKAKLLVEYDFDFTLIGITTTLKSYKLAWELNQALSWRLVKLEDFIVGFKGTSEKPFSAHAYQTQHSYIKVLRNKSSQIEAGNFFLAADQARFDYFLAIKGTEQSFAENILSTIRQITSVEFAAFIPLDSLKTKENFIF